MITMCEKYATGCAHGVMIGPLPERDDAHHPNLRNVERDDERRMFDSDELAARFAATYPYVMGRVDTPARVYVLFYRGESDAPEVVPLEEFRKISSDELRSVRYCIDADAASAFLGTPAARPRGFVYDLIQGFVEWAYAQEIDCDDDLDDLMASAATLGIKPTCRTCGGLGGIDCSSCNGLGAYEYHGLETYCRACRGSGAVPCEDCSE